MKILIATKNPAKILGAKECFLEYFDNVEILPIATNSLVPNQPVNEQILQGATNRIKGLVEYAKENNIEADYYLAIESGLTNYFGAWHNINVAVIEDKEGHISTGTSSAFPVPDRYVEQIIKTDLASVMDELFMDKQTREKQGGISFLSKGKVNRASLTKSAFTMALTQFLNGQIWRN